MISMIWMTNLIVGGIPVSFLRSQKLIDQDQCYFGCEFNRGYWFRSGVLRARDIEIQENQRHEVSESYRGSVSDG
jgi:hypothetical protein